MLTEIILLLLSAFTGFLVSLTDFLVDERRRERLAYAPALFYSVSAVVLIVSNKFFATIYLALLAGMFLVGKINARPHQAAAAVVLFFALAVSPSFDMMFFFFLVAAGIIDELLHDRKWPNSILFFIAEKRLVLEFTALAVSAYSGEWLYFIGVLSFDVGYLFAREIMRKKPPRRKAL